MRDIKVLVTADASLSKRTNGIKGTLTDIEQRVDMLHGMVEQIIDDIAQYSQADEEASKDIKGNAGIEQAFDGEEREHDEEAVAEGNDLVSIKTDKGKDTVSGSVEMENGPPQRRMRKNRKAMSWRRSLWTRKLRYSS